MSLTQRLTEARRRDILALLYEASDFRLNERILKQVLEQMGVTPGADQVRADLQYLSEHGLARLEKLPGERGELWLATLLEPGQDVLRGRAHPGVARLAPL